MGWCHEFGVDIETRCNHPMAAGQSSCSCAECGTVCRGQFEGGCVAVWARGPRHDAPVRPLTYFDKPAFAVAGSNGTGSGSGVVVDVEVQRNGSGGTTEGSSGKEAVTADAESIGTHASQVGRDANPVAVEIGQRLTQVETMLMTLTARVARLAKVEAALSSLAEQVSIQYRSHVSLEGHVADLGKVLGEVGLEIDSRLGNVETMLDGFRPAGDQEGRPGGDSKQEPRTDPNEVAYLVGSGGPLCEPSVRAPASQDGVDRLPEDQDIERGRPVVHVVEVQANGLLPGEIGSTTHLPQSGEPRLDQ